MMLPPASGQHWLAETRDEPVRPHNIGVEGLLPRSVSDLEDWGPRGAAVGGGVVDQRVDLRELGMHGVDQVGDRRHFRHIADEADDALPCLLVDPGPLLLQQLGTAGNHDNSRASLGAGPHDLEAQVLTRSGDHDHVVLEAQSIHHGHEVMLTRLEMWLEISTSSSRPLMLAIAARLEGAHRASPFAFPPTARPA
jgi:hypothetical protein